MHQCRTQHVSNNNRTKQSLVTTSVFKPGVDSFESERISFNRLDKNTIIFWWFVRVDRTLSLSPGWSWKSDIIGSFLSISGSNSHWRCKRERIRHVKELSRSALFKPNYEINTKSSQQVCEANVYSISTRNSKISCINNLTTAQRIFGNPTTSQQPKWEPWFNQSDMLCCWRVPYKESAIG